MDQIWMRRAVSTLMKPENGSALSELCLLADCRLAPDAAAAAALPPPPYCCFAASSCEEQRLLVAIEHGIRRDKTRYDEIR